VPRLWASRKIGLLVDAIREQGAEGPTTGPGPGHHATPRTRELVEEIVRLSTEFGILTEYTSFLAREGTDWSRKEDIFASADGLLRSRAIQTRSGYASVNQDINNQGLKQLSCVNPLNKFLDAEMKESSSVTVQQVCDVAYFKQGNRWVDGRIVAGGSEVRPSRTIAFGTDEFRDLVARLAREGRQGTIALRGDILLLVDGQPVLVQAPSGGTEGNVP